MFTLPLKNKDEVNGTQKGLHYGSHLLLNEVGYGGLGTWKAVKAYNNYTLSSLPTDGQTVTIGINVYTWRTSITTAPNDLLIKGTLAECQAVIQDAINGNSDTVGLNYSSTTKPSELVTCGNFVANVAKIEAIIGGTTGNSIATVATGGSFSSATLLNGLEISKADGILLPTPDDGNLTGDITSTVNMFDYWGNSGVPSYSQTMSLRLMGLSGDFDKNNYASGESKKRVMLDSVGARVKSISKIMLEQKLKESNGVGLYTTITSIKRIVPMGTDRFVIWWGSTYFQIVQVATDGTLTIGTTFTHTVAVDDFDVVGDGKIVGIRYVGTTSNEAQYFTVTGTTMVHNSSNTISGITGNLANSMTVKCIAPDKAVLVYKNAVATHGIRIVDVSSGSISISGADTPITPTNPAVSTVIVSHDTNKFAIFFNNQVFIGFATGTAVTVGTAQAIETSTIQQTHDNNNFDAIALDTTNILYTCKSSAVYNYKFKGFQQILISGNTCSVVMEHWQDTGSTAYYPNPRLVKFDTNDFGLYFAPSGWIARYPNATLVMVPISYNGTLATISKGYRETNRIVGVDMKYSYIKNAFAMGDTYSIWVQSASASIANIAVFKRGDVELYNHETLMATVNMKYPAVSQVVDLDGNDNAQINDNKLYLKIKNPEAEAREIIKVTGVFVEMD